jgi:ADP-heptose:LPS heptosyltransferase
MSKQTKHILVIRLSAMGDVAMVVPVLKAFKEQHPDVEITILTRAFFAPFFRDLNGVKVFSADLKGKHIGISGLYKLARQLNKENHFYAIADLHNVLRTKVLKQFISCKRFVSIDKGRKEKKALTSGKIFKQLKTTTQRYVDVFETLGFPINLKNSTFPKPKVLSIKVVEILGIKTTKWIGIAPFAAHESKMYSLELMKTVIETLSKTHQIILFGGGDKEKGILNDFEATLENVINTAGKFNLDEELDIISNLDVMLSMDSGNAHIAAMLGIKVVTIWGVTHPFAGFAPFNQPEDYALLPDKNQFPKTPTSVYGNKYPVGYENAASSISSERIVEKIKSII